MSLYKISNRIFDLGLNTQEISVYAYLCSLPADTKTITGMEIVKVKQSTIGLNCGLRSLQTVAKVLAGLAEHQLIEPLERAYKRSGRKGTYQYDREHSPKGGKAYEFVISTDSKTAFPLFTKQGKADVLEGMLYSATVTTATCKLKTQRTDTRSHSAAFPAM